jgi:hypothetical protein
MHKKEMRSSYNTVAAAASFSDSLPIADVANSSDST